MKIQVLKTVIPVVALMLASCGRTDDSALSVNDGKDTGTAKTAQQEQSLKVKNYERFSEDPGIVGIYNVPEMLTLCITDSAKEADLAASFARDYSLLLEEMKTLGITSDGAPGSIYYNNNPNNFIFECVYPIGKLPQKTPKKCRVVVLEATPMLIYNYYGPYRDLYKAYGDIKTYLSQNKTEQTGPLREFYINDPIAIPDSSKWLTRIMVPVGKPKK